MPFDRPTLAQLIERGSADLESRLPGTDPRLRRANTHVLGRVHAGAVHGLYGHLDWVSRQILPDTSDAEILIRQAALKSVLRKAAAVAQGSIGFTGADDSTIPAGTVLQRSDGARFTTDADSVIASGTATIAVTAQVAGAAGNTAANSTLTLVSPVAGVVSAATVGVDGLTDGVDQEFIEDLRTRFLERLKEAPHAGIKLDYEAWALEVPGVTRAWCVPRAMGPGTIVLRFMRDGDPDPIPDLGAIAAVQAYIDARRPVTADVYVLAPIAVPLNFTLAVTPSTAAIKAAVAAELADLLSREAEPGGTIRITHIDEAISLAEGETDHAVTLPAGDVTHTAGQIATMGTITWA